MADASGGGWRRMTSGVRFRTTLVAVVVVGVVLGIVLVTLAVQTRFRLERTIESAAEARAQDLAALVASGDVSDPLPGGSTELFAQIVDPEGAVVATNSIAAGTGPFVAVSLPAGSAATWEVDDLLEPLEEFGDVEDEGPYLVAGLGADGPDGPVTVYVASSLEPARLALGTLSPLLLVGFPIVLAVVGVTVWTLTGRALRPVEAVRAQAEEISASQLDRRLPVPASSDEIHRLAATLNSMLDRIEASALRRRQFVADASHELKSPVAAIRTMLDVVGEDPSFSDWGRLLGDLRREDDRLDRIVSDLLVLARSDEGLPPSTRVEVDVDQVVGREVDAIRDLTSVDIDTSLLRPVRSLGDPAALSALFRNVLDNACRYAASRVEVTAAPAGADVVVRITDDGPGIPEEDREVVFARFVRLDDARSRDAGGTGLGLAVARAVARSHDGSIAVVDEPGAGTTVETRLPAV